MAVQIDACELPLEFQSIQAELMPEGAEGTANTAWLNLLMRIGDILERPGLAEYARLSSDSDLDGWKRWLRRFASDPLAASVIDRIVDFAMPDMRKQLAGERAKRQALEVQLTEHEDNAKAQSTEIATSTRELVKLRSELEEVRSGRQQAETELERFRTASGSKAGSEDNGIGIMLQDREAIYVAVLLWAFAITFSSENISDLMDGRADIGDIFWLIFAIAALFFPAVVITGKLVRKKFAMARLESDDS